MNPFDCLRIPTSLDDAQTILTCAGGQDWRSLFGLGLGALAAAIAVLVATLLILRAVIGRPR